MEYNTETAPRRQCTWATGTGHLAGQVDELQDVAGNREAEHDEHKTDRGHRGSTHGKGGTGRDRSWTWRRGRA